MSSPSLPRQPPLAQQRVRLGIAAAKGAVGGGGVLACCPRHRRSVRASPPARDRKRRRSPRTPRSRRRRGLPTRDSCSSRPNNRRRKRCAGKCGAEWRVAIAAGMPIAARVAALEGGDVDIAGIALQVQLHVDQRRGDEFDGRRSPGRKAAPRASASISASGIGSPV